MLLITAFSLTKQLPAAAGNNADESGESEPKNPKNQKDGQILHRAEGNCQVIILCGFINTGNTFHIQVVILITALSCVMSTSQLIILIMHANY